MQVLGHLGYRPVAVVRKHRRTYRLERQGLALLTCLDEVDRLGRFVELEVLAREDQSETAARVLAETAAALGLTQVEKRSYLEMVLEAQAVGAGSAEFNR
jgi:adenylate cyclase class 2